MGVYQTYPTRADLARSQGGPKENPVKNALSQFACLTLKIVALPVLVVLALVLAVVLHSNAPELCDLPSTMEI